MLLYVMRHGIAFDRLDPACPPDPERPLTDEGIRKTAVAARGLASLRPAVDAVITSPYRRARETAELACEALEFPAAELALCDGLTPEVRPEHTVAALESMVSEDAGGAVVTGHAPNLDLLVSYLIAGPGPERVFLRKSAVALVDLEFGWGPGRGTLLWLLPPKVLRRLGGG